MTRITILGAGGNMDRRSTRASLGNETYGGRSPAGADRRRHPGPPARPGPQEVVDRLGALRTGFTAAGAELWTPPQESLESTIDTERRWAEESVACRKTLLR